MWLRGPRPCLGLLFSALHFKGSNAKRSRGSLLPVPRMLAPPALLAIGPARRRPGTPAALQHYIRPTELGRAVLCRASWTNWIVLLTVCAAVGAAAGGSAGGR